MIIRPDTPADFDAIDLVHVSAFGQEGEARLVRNLRKSKAVQVSLVAEVAGEIAGHILFSPVSAAVNPRRLRISGLAPLGVAPAYHRMGIGSALVQAGLAACQELGIAAVVVLGDPGYYQRFGFTRADLAGLTCEYDAPPECFMVKELVSGSTANCSGLVKYQRAFQTLEEE
jgi:putative acetyltransferase